MLFLSSLFFSYYSPSCQFSPYTHLKIISAPSSLGLFTMRLEMFTSSQFICLLFIDATEFSPFLDKEILEFHSYPYPVDIMFDATFSNLATYHFDTL